MPEVIDLLSSPAITPPKPRQTITPQAHVDSPIADVFNIHFDDFDLSSPPAKPNLPSAQPKKKRRLGPPDLKRSETKPSQKWSFLFSDESDDTFSVEKIANVDKIAVTTTTSIEELQSDPITFSSSAPEPRTVQRAAKSVIIDLVADHPDDEDLLSLSQPIAPARTHLSERTANLLANIAGSGNSKYKSTTKNSKLSTTTSSTGPLKRAKTTKRAANDEIFSSSPPKPKEKTSKASIKEKDIRDAERTATKAKKEEEKEAEKERKRLAKEEKAREKQRAADIAEVNKSKVGKKNSTPEMVLDMARSFEGTSVGDQVLEYMKILGVETTFFDDHLDLSESDATFNLRGNLVRWRRKVKAQYNEEIGHWEPIPVEKIETEKHILIHIRAQEFLEVAASGLPPNEALTTQEKNMTKNLDKHVSSLRSRYPNCKPIYLIEGLTTFLRKNKNATNRAYAATVRSQLPTYDPTNPPTSHPPTRKKKNHNPTPTTDLSTVTDDLSTSLLLHLQLHHPGILIHHTPSPSLSATWIRAFTTHISTIPYRHQRMHTNDAVGFCMDVGQVKTGDDGADTFVKMLQEVQRVTPAMAYGIQARYVGVGELVRAFRSQGPAVLADVVKARNRDGALSERVMGPRVSKRLCKVWLGREEGSGEGIS